jgi:hypothetical protein
MPSTHMGLVVTVQLPGSCGTNMGHEKLAVKMAL